MSTLITINVTNNSNTSQDFFFFQAPAIYTGGGQVYSNSIWQKTIESHASSGGYYTFYLDLQYYAAVQQAHSASPTVGQPSGYSSAIRSIELTPNPDGSENNCTIMNIDPSLGLSVPAHAAGVESGAFRIVVPNYDPNANFYNGGNGVVLSDGTEVLSNFVLLQPGQNLDCQPVLQFYVAVGSYTAGSVMNFSSSSETAALCDATEGQYTFNVSYNDDGSWTVTNGNDDAKTAQRASSPIVRDTNILNEAGTQVICQGRMVSAAPLTIANLTAPNHLHVHSEYQVSVHNGPRRGLMLTGLTNSQATFG